MKREHRRRDGKPAIELIEEATHLLRTAPVATLAVYYAGALPFVLGLLYFCADMSRSPFAEQHVAEAALGTAGLFLWMKFCQALFLRRIRAQITAQPMPRWNLRQSCRVFLHQAIVQPSGLFLIPLSLIPVLPFAWIYGYYQNASALGGDESRDLSTVMKKSWRQASLWPWQNHLLLLVMSLFGLCIFLNWIIVCFSLPQLLKMLLGVESMFTQSPLSLLNATFFTAMFGLSYLSVDPILKIIYALRCFYGESLQSGEDLKSEVKQFSATTPSASLAALVLFLALLAAPLARAAEAPPAPTPASSPKPAGPQLSPTELDRSLAEVIRQRKYTWRMPREEVATDAEKGMITRFLERAMKLVREWVKAAFEWFEKILKKFFKNKDGSASSGSGYGWIASLQVLLYALVAAAILALAFLLYRIWRARQQRPAPVVSEAIQPVPDVADENIGADQLPEDGWMKLARELLQRGEFRLAMRAFYLASLAHLAARNLISLARFKSNRDYERELQRRAHAIPALVPMFGENIFLFERIWYGRYEATGEIVNQFASNVEKIKAGA